MKKQLKKIICFTLLLIAYGCSSEQYVVKKEITLDELKKLEGTTSVLTLTTKDTLFSDISSWEIRDSTLAFLDFGKNYAEKISRYNVNNLGDLERQKNLKMKRYYKYPRPDTLLVSFKSINRIEYSGNEDQNSSEDKRAFLGGGYELDARKNELTAGLLIENQLGLYRLIVEYNTTFNYSTNILRVSSSALYSIGYTFVGIIIGSAITGDPIVPGAKKKQNNTDNTIVYTLIGLPLLVTNAEHQFYIINPSANNTSRSVGISVFAEFRTDIFDTKWIVYSPGAGIQLEYFFSENNYGSYNNSMNFQVCIEYPYEFRFNQFQEPMISAGVKYKIGY
jgi:hypothetical protein